MKDIEAPDVGIVIVMLFSHFPVVSFVFDWGKGKGKGKAEEGRNGGFVGEGFIVRLT